MNKGKRTGKKTGKGKTEDLVPCTCFLPFPSSRIRVLLLYHKYVALAIKQKQVTYILALTASRVASRAPKIAPAFAESMAAASKAGPYLLMRSLTTNHPS